MSTRAPRRRDVGPPHTYQLYEGPQLSMHHKVSGPWMTGAIRTAWTTDEAWISPDGVLGHQPRNAVVATRPGGTIEVQKISMARRIGLGWKQRELTGTVH